MSLSFPRFSGMMPFPRFPRRSGNEGNHLFQWFRSEISFPGTIIPGNEQLSDIVHEFSFPRSPLRGGMGSGTIPFPSPRLGFGALLSCSEEGEPFLPDARGQCCPRGIIGWGGPRPLRQWKGRTAILSRAGVS